jgi:choline-sulfatase
MVERPDIVLVMTDQQRYDQVGFRSAGHYETPVLDEMARQGVMFSNAYSSAATCIPARIGLLTGVQALRLPTEPGTIALRPGVWTIAHALRASGYETALIGKMHFTPMHSNHGFDVMRTSEHLNASVHALRPDGSPDLDDYHQWLVDQGVARWGTLEVGKQPTIAALPPPEGAGKTVFPYRLEYHDTTWVENEARSYLARREGGRPMFLVVSFPHPHPPLNPPEPYASRYDEGAAEIPTDTFDINRGLPDSFTAAMDPESPEPGSWHVERHGLDALRSRLTMVRALVRQIDDALGRLLALLPRERTIVAFTSDHGDFGGHRGLLGKNPWIPFDDLVRIPLVIAGPGVASGRTVSSLVQSTDLPLTFCDLAGIEYPAPPDELDSASLAPWLLSPDESAAPDRPALFISNFGWPGARLGSLKMIRHWSGSRSVFDLERDPHESCNIADEPAYRDGVEELDHIVDTAIQRGRLQLPTFTEVGQRAGG